MTLLRWLSGLAMSASYVLPVLAQERSPITPEKIVSLRIASDVAISPDGRAIVFVIDDAPRAIQPGARRRSTLWIVPSGGSSGPKRLEQDTGDTTSNAWSPRWSPDGRSVGFISDRARGGDAQVYLLPMTNPGGPSRSVTAAPGGITRFSWSPDGQELAYTTQDPPSPHQTELAKRTDAIEVEREFRYTRLWTVNVASGIFSLVTRDSIDVQEFDWSPDGNAFAVVGAATPRPDDALFMSLSTVDRRTGRMIHRLADGLSITGVLRWSPDGRWITFFESPAPPPNRPFAFWLSIVSPAGGAPRGVMKDSALSVLAVEWLKDSRRLVAQSVEGTHQTLRILDIPTGTSRVLTTLNISQGDFSFGTNGELVAYLNQSAESPSDVWTSDMEGRTRRLTNLNPQTSSWRLGKVSEVTWKNSVDGLLRRGVLVTPPDYVPGRRYPTVVQGHLGDLPWYTGWLGRWWAWAQLLASNGYVVFLPNYRGVTGEGWALHETNANWGVALQDLNDGLDYLIKEGIADPNALGIGGWSNGGYMTEWAITHTKRFKAAIAEAGHSDFFSLYGASYLRASLRLSYLDNPFLKRDQYDAHSPITFIRNVTTPTLVIHGGRDRGVPVGQGYEFFYGLQSLGVESEMVVYPNEGHGISSPANQVDFQYRLLSWFNKHLRGGSQ